MSGGPHLRARLTAPAALRDPPHTYRAAAWARPRRTATLRPCRPRAPRTASLTSRATSRPGWRCRPGGARRSVPRRAGGARACSAGAGA